MNITDKVPATIHGELRLQNKIIDNNITEIHGGRNFICYVQTYNTYYILDDDASKRIVDVGENITLISCGCYDMILVTVTNKCFIWDCGNLVEIYLSSKIIKVVNFSYKIFLVENHQCYGYGKNHCSEFPTLINLPEKIFNVISSYGETMFLTDKGIYVSGHNGSNLLGFENGKTFLAN